MKPDPALARPPSRSCLPPRRRLAAGRSHGLAQSRPGSIRFALENDEAAQLDLAHEGSAVESAGLRFMSPSIPDRRVPTSTQQALSPLANIAAALEQGHNVAVHCRQGIGRSDLVAASLLVMSRAGVEKAIEVVSAARGQAIPETPEQLEWIKHLPSEKSYDQESSNFRSSSSANLKVDA